MTVSPHRRRVPTSTEALLVGLLLCAVLGVWLREGLAGNVTLATAGTVFCGVFVQALPFLVLGVLVSGLIAAYLPPERLARWLPQRHGAAVLVGGIAGAALPGCECGSVPMARRLFGDGGAVGAASLAFMLSAPAINPVVLVATAVAFPGEPRMVVARCAASLATAVIMGAAWSRWGRPAWITQPVPRSDDETASRWTVFSEAARHDFVQAASYLVIGAAAAAAMRVAVPPWVFEHVAGHLIVGVLVMALLAFVLALCSEADAFVAASLTMVPLVPRLVFLVVGPAVDVKLVAMQTGLFGRAFALRFAPLTMVVAATSATVIGLLVLGGR
ncbi:permease [Mycolicibacterium stellerae]|uniref:permease n=1 Tax=Mycolicibacterium stellerae TaxID=2358193 RepID=UPI000F0BC25F|nr:permease [Mycolicibacterium stellerae]